MVAVTGLAARSLGVRALRGVAALAGAAFAGALLAGLGAVFRPGLAAVVLTPLRTLAFLAISLSGVSMGLGVVLAGVLMVLASQIGGPRPGFSTNSILPPVTSKATFPVGNMRNIFTTLRLRRGPSLASQK